MKVTRALLDKKSGETIGQEEHECTADECNRADTTYEGLAALKPHFDRTSGEGSVTAGNASQMSDGAAAALVMSRSRADALGVCRDEEFLHLESITCRLSGSIESSHVVDSK